jgi:hypothetical protein
MTTLLRNVLILFWRLSKFISFIKRTVTFVELILVKRLEPLITASLLELAKFMEDQRHLVSFHGLGPLDCFDSQLTSETMNPFQIHVFWVVTPYCVMCVVLW